MNINSFHGIIKKAGTTVSITRPSTAEVLNVTMGSPGTVRDEALLMDAEQSDEQVVFCAVDFSSPTFEVPQKGDRIVDADGTTSSIQQVRKMWGTDRTLFGWRVRIRG